MSGDAARTAPPAAAEGAAAAGNRPRYAGYSHPLIRDLFLHPTRWSIWPAVAALRWLFTTRATQDRQAGEQTSDGRRPASTARRMDQGVLYRSTPSLTFSSSEITDVAMSSRGVILTLEAPGLAGDGSLLPSSDIERIVDDHRRGGALSVWLDGPCDLFMQAAEAARFRCHAAFSLATGGRIGALDSADNLVGRPAALLGSGGGRADSAPLREPEDVTGIAALFLGPVSAVGLTDLLHAFTELPVRVREFAGAEVPVLRPARVGGMFGAMLGTRCTLADAGIEIVVEGDGDPQGPAWAGDARRRESLYRFARSYIGSPSPIVRIELRLDAHNVPPAVLDGSTALGGLALLGRSEGPVTLPLAARTSKLRIGMHSV